jgi:maleate cis-trans isomerase
MADIRRLGFLIPERNVVCEREFAQFVPEGVSCHFSRLARDGSELTQASLIAMMSQAAGQAQLLTGFDPDVIMCACTSGSFLGNGDTVDELAETVRNATSVECYTTSRAVLDALATFDARRVYLVTPYPDDINEEEMLFLQRAGLEVTGLASFRRQRSEEIRALSSRDVETLVLDARTEIAGSDAVFISCTNLIAMDRLEALEAALGIPVISSNSATLWRALNAAGTPTAAVRAGRLFSAGLSGIANPAFRPPAKISDLPA